MRYSIVISQGPSGTFSAQQFAYMLRNIRFAHDPMRPLMDQYAAYISVSVYDGSFSSPLAFTRVDVFITNIPPTVLIGGRTSTSVLMFDGDTEVRIFQQEDSLMLLEDTLTIQEVSVTLTNPADSEERLRVSPPTNIPGNISITSINGTTVLFTGPASPVDFSQALTETVIFHEYLPMQGILQGEGVPNLEDR